MGVMRMSYPLPCGGRGRGKWDWMARGERDGWMRAPLLSALPPPTIFTLTPSHPLLNLLLSSTAIVISSGVVVGSG